MTHPGELVPAEEKQSDECGFEEERHQALDRQRRAEHIANVMTVISPVHAKLKFHGDPGGDAHGEVDAEQHAPEFCHLPPDIPAGHDVHTLHDAEQD